MFVPRWGVLLFVVIIVIIVVITTTVVLVKEDNTKPSKLQYFLEAVSAE
jgi:F0F1-type ATP synthase membrane subunit a